MSKDFTPANLYAADKKLTESGNSLRTLKLVNINSNRPIVQIEKDAKNEYPELQFLLDGFVIIYRDYHNTPAGKSVLDKIENEIKLIETKFEQGERNYTNYHPDYNSIHEITSLWFFGKLDHNFYYNTQNNALFREFIIHTINKRKDCKKNNGGDEQSIRTNTDSIKSDS